MWLSYILDSRKADCPKCKEKTNQELRVASLKYIYSEGWVCINCYKDPKGIPVVEDGEIRFLKNGETVEEVAKKKISQKTEIVDKKSKET